MYCSKLIHQGSLLMRLSPRIRDYKCLSTCAILSTNIEKILTPIENAAVLRIRCKSTAFTRTFSSSSSSSTDPPSDQTNNQVLAYVGNLTHPVKVLKLFSISTSLVGIAAQPILYKALGTVHVAVLVSFGTFFCLFTYCTPFLFHWVLKRYVIRLTFDPSSQLFTAYTFNFIGREKTLTFSAKDVHVPDIGGAFTTLTAKGVPLLINPTLFKDADVYSHLMGLDKPMDFLLKKEEPKKTEEEDNKV